MPTTRKRKGGSGCVKSNSILAALNKLKKKANNKKTFRDVLMNDVLHNLNTDDKRKVLIKICIKLDENIGKKKLSNNVLIEIIRKQMTAWNWKDYVSTFLVSIGSWLIFKNVRTYIRDNPSFENSYLEHSPQYTNELALLLGLGGAGLSLTRKKNSRIENEFKNLLHTHKKQGGVYKCEYCNQLFAYNANELANDVLCGTIYDTVRHVRKPLLCDEQSTVNSFFFGSAAPPKEQYYNRIKKELCRFANVCSVDFQKAQEMVENKLPEGDNKNELNMLFTKMLLLKQRMTNLLKPDCKNYSKINVNFADGRNTQINTQLDTVRQLKDTLTKLTGKKNFTLYEADGDESDGEIEDNVQLTYDTDSGEELSFFAIVNDNKSLKNIICSLKAIYTDEVVKKQLYIAIIISCIIHRHYNVVPSRINSAFLNNSGNLKNDLTEQKCINVLGSGYPLLLHYTICDTLDKLHTVIFFPKKESAAGESGGEEEEEKVQETKWNKERVEKLEDILADYHLVLRSTPDFSNLLSVLPEFIDILLNYIESIESIWHLR